MTPRSRASPAAGNNRLEPTGMSMNPIKYMLLITALLPLPLLMTQRSHASTQGLHVINTPHNLSTSGGGGVHDVKAVDEERVCVFCHTPHHATTDGPLWSRKSNISMYVPYASTTIIAEPQQPLGPSRLCLSCHDGTVALGKLVGDYPLSTLGQIPSDADPKKNSNLGLNLTTSHPISMPYGMSSELHDAVTLEAKGIKLEEGTYVECTSCHDAHNNQFGNFLVQDSSTQHDALCTSCHNTAGWSNQDSTHRTGGARYAVEVTDQVEADGCVNCHMPHGAQLGAHLLKLPQVLFGEETNCTGSCHKGVAYTGPSGPDIVTQLAKPYSHPVQNYPLIHVENEFLPVTGDVKHVQCVDCHNPHQSGREGGPLGSATPDVLPASVAPDVNGALRGVRGVAITGLPLVDNGGVARYEYEICFRCHAGADAPQFVTGSVDRPRRLYATYEQELRFAPGNPSYHPVSTDTIGRTGRSLLEPLKNTQIRIYCSDCHAPHGSDHRYILRAQNEEVFPSGTVSYPLCFSCHNQDFLMNPLAAPHSGAVLLHKTHVSDYLAPCSACHDPHGVPALRGGTSTNSAHLVNFDKRYAGDAALYDSTQPNPNCTVAGTCHTTVAQQQFYPDAGAGRRMIRPLQKLKARPTARPAPSFR